jgi:hypothetical protein
MAEQLFQTMHPRTKRLFALLAAALLGSPGLWALPPATYTLVAGDGVDTLQTTSGTYLGVPVTLSASSTVGGTSQASVTVTGGPDPSIVAASSSTNRRDPGANATLIYNFEVTGTSANVPLVFNGTYSQNLTYVAGIDPSVLGIYSDATGGSQTGLQVLFQTSPSYSGTSYRLQSVNSGLYVVSSSSGYLPMTGFGSVTINQTAYVAPNYVYSVRMVSGVYDYTTYSPNSVTLDPTIAIDPAFLAANPGVTLSFSPDFAAAIPEPSTDVALSGLAVLGFAAYRRRHRHAS